MQKYKLVSGLAASLTAGSLAMAYGFEYWYQLDPCPLCLVQRYIFFAMLATFISAFVMDHQKWARWLNAATATLLGILGQGVASRHIWLQSLPEELKPTSCMASLEQLFNNLPLKRFLLSILQGGSECAKIDFRFLGLSIPWWSSIGYMSLITMSLYLLFVSKHADK